MLTTEAKNFDRHSKIRQLIERIPDQPLATLGLAACQSLINYWRNLPPRIDGKGYYSSKRSREQLGELDRFFTWLHRSEKFGWRKPEDFNELFRNVKKSASKTNLPKMSLTTFSLDELAILVRQAEMPTRLWIMWCLNTSQGAAEVGRVQWDDLFFDQDHPWRKEGLDIWSGGNRAGFLRPKTDVLGWWLLWPETVGLLMEWRQ